MRIVYLYCVRLPRELNPVNEIFWLKEPEVGTTTAAGIEIFAVRTLDVIVNVTVALPVPMPLLALIVAA